MKKIFSLTLGLAVALIAIGYSAPSANAQTLPAGCSSNVGYSTSSGVSCNGALVVPVGCSSTAGFNTSTGLPCNGASSISANGGMLLPTGCSSTVGFSTADGRPCNGSTYGFNNSYFPSAGCSANTGFSPTTGIACNVVSGGSAVGGYNLLPGCTTVSGYSVMTGYACSLSPAMYVPPTVTPTLPDTGAGANGTAVALLLLSGMLVTFGVTRLSTGK